jgi:hypothetical protein
MNHCLVNHYIICHLMFVLVSPELVMMCPSIDNSVRCEIRAVDLFLASKSRSDMEICPN